jgi:hypothetical protein
MQLRAGAHPLPTFGGKGAVTYSETTAGYGESDPQLVGSARSRVWWPAALALIGALGAIVLSYVGLTGEESRTRLVAGLIGYLVGALLVAILANIQRALDIRAEGLNYRGLLQRIAPDVAKLSMWVGLVAGLAGAFALASELAR